ncbi:AAA-domain-containing protein [Xylariaceae sp. FL0255]|nr:AAA-domain-containing protein [Xylariaceae sp. FL0255]
MDIRNNLFGRGPRPTQPNQQPSPSYRPRQDGYNSVSQQRPQESYNQRPPYPPDQYSDAPSQNYKSSNQFQRADQALPEHKDFLQVDLLNTVKGRNICTVSAGFCTANNITTERFNLVLKDQYHVTATRHVGNEGANIICVGKDHRDWMQLRPVPKGELERSKIPLEGISVKPDPKVPKALSRVDLKAKYFSPTASPGPNELEQGMLSKYFMKCFGDTLLAPGQHAIFDIDARIDTGAINPRTDKIPIECIVESIYINGVEITDPKEFGILDLGGKPETIFYKDQDSKINITLKRGKRLIRPDFKLADLGIGGLDDEFSTIFRRAFASRAFDPNIVAQMGITHVRGLLLYGPPGTGKTLIAREIGKMLNAKEPKIINGPEILNKYVGQSEENIRKVFADAEKEQKEKGIESDLHIIIFDELDAVCKQRGSGSGGTGVGDSVVNQLLSKLDGVEQLNNLLLIGMTNRKDMIDDALLRPGRLEVHVEISLPDEAGRVQILNIHLGGMRKHNRLDKNVDVADLAKRTKNFSGAEIAGLVKAAGSYAFLRHTKLGDVTGKQGNANEVSVGRGDLEAALGDIQPAFGVSQEELNSAFPYGIIEYSTHIRDILSTGQSLVRAVQTSERMNLSSVLIHGPVGSGKTALAAQIGLKSEFPFVKIIRSIDVGTNESAKIEYIRRAFSDAYKSQFSILILDNIEKIIDWNPIGPRFSNAVIQYLGALLETRPPKGRRLLIIATTSQRSMLRQHGVLHFDREIAVPAVKDQGELRKILEESNMLEQPGIIENTLSRLQADASTQEVGIGVKAVFAALEAWSSDPNSQSLAAIIHETMISENSDF